MDFALLLVRFNHHGYYRTARDNRITFPQKVSKKFEYSQNIFLPVSKMPLAPQYRSRGGGAGAEGLTVGQTMAGAGGGGGGGGWLEAAAASSFRGGSGKVKLVLGLAPKVCTFLISHRPDDKSVSRVRGLIKKARLTRAEIAKAIANPNTNSSSLPLAPRSLVHYKL